MKNVDINWNNMTLPETMKQLKLQAKDNEILWTDELDIDFAEEIEFLLTYKGRWLLCHIGKTPPFTIRYRLVGTRNYERCKPKTFIGTAKKVLLH